MAGLGKQSKTKKVKRAVDMSPSAEELASADRWDKPDKDECDEHTYVSCPPEGDPQRDKLVQRLVWHGLTGALVEFSIVLMHFRRGSWHEVAEADSCHDDDAHVHQNVSSTGERVGDPLRLMVIRTIEEVQDAYAVALTTIEDHWQKYKERWHHG